MDMRTGRLRSALWVALVIAMGVGSSHGELAVSVTITGPIDEILPLLERLKDMGVGAPSADEALKVELRSVAKAPEPAAPPKPRLALEGLQVAPPLVSVGEPVLLSVRVSDPAGVVDTVAATISGVAGSVDLYDNGTHGDAVPNDGVWSASVVTETPLTPGQHTVAVNAFNAFGTVVTVPGADGKPAPLTCETEIAVHE